MFRNVKRHLSKISFTAAAPPANYKNKLKRQGFSLVELIVVMVIIGLLASLVAIRIASSDPTTCGASTLPTTNHRHGDVAKLRQHGRRPCLPPIHQRPHHPR